MRSIPRQQRQGIRTMHKKDFQLLRCLFMKSIVHIFGDSLIVPYTIYQGIPTSEISTPWELARGRFLFNLGFFIHLLPCCTDFFIYAVVSKDFRQKPKQIVSNIFGQNLVIERNNDKQQELRAEPPELRIVSTIELAT
ncbi:unnamed protein product [Adineta steineri]|uniref:Uncharacterized protein n=1 Tax=Adineta steineri TaxID=433720 RepID=A0A814IQ79_9BILA|nr:unnamed protein product [Adineta steineri]CAF1403655.1 unnamed protein product [Adineta steineri]CAF1601138.1 unnamed protein product [Adineta steineri]